MSSYLFSKIILDKREVFFKSKLSLAFVNLKPLVNGHVLVIPIRVVKRFSELTDDEASDLMLSTKRVASVIEREYHASSLSIAIQDGPQAGQSVPHVHVHIIPRVTGDWPENDKIYEDLNNNRIEDGNRPERSIQEMEAEALNLRRFFDISFTEDI